jgi:hypothetical protein
MILEKSLKINISKDLNHNQITITLKILFNTFNNKCLLLWAQVLEPIFTKENNKQSKIKLN